MDTNKVWLVTGASKGLGLALVNRLIAQGYKVAGTSRTIASLENVISKSDNFLPLQMDILNEENVRSGIGSRGVYYTWEYAKSAASLRDGV